MWLETGKMRSNMTSDLLGGALLGDMLLRIGDAAKAYDAGFPVCM